MRAYSVDLRTKILRAVDAGMSKSEAARVFDVGLATVKRYARQRRETGMLTPRSHPGRPPTIRADQEAAIEAQLVAHPDATLEEHCDFWEATFGVRVSTSTMSRMQRRLGWTVKKKSLIASERDEDLRAEWWTQMARIDPMQLVFADESGINIAMTPRYARAPKGQRAYGKVPRAYGQNVTLIAALSPLGIGAVMTLGGAADMAAFTVYVQEILAPSLRSGQLVVLDNVTIHQDARVRQLIEDRGCNLLFLPKYSSDFAPIDLAFSKIKQYLRRAKARTREDLEAAVGEAIETITPQDAHGYFRHCGYLLPTDPSQPGALALPGS